MNARDIFARRIRAAIEYEMKRGVPRAEEWTNDDGSVTRVTALGVMLHDAYIRWGFDPRAADVVDAMAEHLNNHLLDVVKAYRVPAAMRAPVAEYLADRCWNLHDVPEIVADTKPSTLAERKRSEWTMDGFTHIATEEFKMEMDGARAPVVHWPTDVTLEEVAAVVARSTDPNAKTVAASLRGGQWFVAGPRDKNGMGWGYRVGSMHPKPELYTAPSSDPELAAAGYRRIGDDQLYRALDTIYHPRLAALIAHAEKAVHTMRKGRFIAVDASSVNAKVLAQWAQTPTDRHGVAERLRVTRDDRAAGFKVVFEDDEIQMRLPLDGIQGDIVDAIQRARGHEGLRHWAAIQHLFSVKGGRTGRVVWTVNDHMRAMGYSAEAMRDRKTRERVVKVVAALARLRLAVYDKSKTLRIRRPLLLTVEEAERLQEDGQWTVEGMTLEMHPELYRGVRTADGGFGTNWFPASPDLPKLHHQKYPHALILGQRLPQRLRWAMGEGRTYIDLTGRNLLEFAGIRLQRGHHPGRVWETLDVNVAVLQGLPTAGMGALEWLRDANTLDGVARLHAATWQRTITFHRLSPIEAPPLPTTGAELRAARERLRLTQADLGRALGVTERTIRNAEKAATLPPSVRRAIERGALPSLDAPDGTPRALR